jgi:hypothetical protein
LESDLGGLDMKNADQIPEDLALEVACPVCEAPVQEGCHVQPGVLRSESHLERIELGREVEIERLAETERFIVLPLRGGRRKSDRV